MVDSDSVLVTTRSSLAVGRKISAQINGLILGVFYHAFVEIMLNFLWGYKVIKRLHRITLASVAAVVHRRTVVFATIEVWSFNSSFFSFIQETPLS